MYNPLFQQYLATNKRRPSFTTYISSRHPMQYIPVTNYYNQYHYRDYPPVDPSLFIKSANEMQSLIQDCSKIINKISNSKSFATKLMDEAQKSNNSEVKKMLASLGLQNLENFSYTPDGLVVSLDRKLDSIDCCQLTLKLRWR